MNFTMHEVKFSRVFVPQWTYYRTFVESYLYLEDFNYDKNLKWNIKIRWFTTTRWACIISCFMWDFPRRKLTRIPDTNLIPMMTFKDIHFPNFSTNLWRMELAPFNPSSNLLFLVKDNKRAMLHQISSIQIDQDQKGDSSV